MMLEEKMTDKMTDKEIEAAITQLTEWKVVNGKLNRSFKFNNFVDAFAFMTKVAMVAEKADHYPELFNVYNRVAIDLTTHDVGGIGILDIELAKKINAL
jgi:4a-hydroxytetrahydrobiopterin dehydratase